MTSSYRLTVRPNKSFKPSPLRGSACVPALRLHAFAATARAGLTQVLGLMKHAPLGYECPFCDIAAGLSGPNPNSAIVFADANLLAVIPLHYYGGIKGNCLVVPLRECA